MRYRSTSISPGTKRALSIESKDIDERDSFWRDLPAGAGSESRRCVASSNDSPQDEQKDESAGISLWQLGQVIGGGLYHLNMNAEMLLNEARMESVYSLLTLGEGLEMRACASTSISLVLRDRRVPFTDKISIEVDVAVSPHPALSQSERELRQN